MYINAKMSHKLDAPATLNVVSEGVRMGTRSLDFAASKDQKRFSLSLALHADIDPDVRGGDTRGGGTGRRGERVGWGRWGWGWGRSWEGVRGREGKGGERGGGRGGGGRG